MSSASESAKGSGMCEIQRTSARFVWRWKQQWREVEEPGMSEGGTVSRTYQRFLNFQWTYG